MQPEIAARLVDLNRQFYQSFANQFSATRQRLQPGVRRVLERLPLTSHILDLGCGNGELARELYRRGFTGHYLGLDFSLDLLALAQVDLPARHFTFCPADLADPAWPDCLAGQGGPFDGVWAFAVLHHIPQLETRLQILRSVRQVLTSAGQFVHSEWQFLHSPRLTGRVLPWATIGLAESDVDTDDYLLDWRSGGLGLRYAHHYSEPELADLAAASGFRVEDTWHSDGEGGRLGLYQVWGQDS